MNLSIKNWLVLLVCSISLILVGCKKSSSTSNYDVSVQTTGLIGSGVVVQLNGAYNLTIPSNGTSTFSTQFPNNSPYGIVIKSQPTLPPQTCVLANANGTISSANVSNVMMTCGPVGFAYLTNSTGNTIIQLAADKTTGALALNSGPISTGNGPAAFALDQTGRYAFVVNKLDSTIGSFLRNTTNGLLVSSGSAIGTGASSSPVAVAVDPSGKYVYVANSGSSSVAGFTINATTSALTCIGNSGTSCPSAGTTGNAPVALVATTAQNGTEYLYVANSAGDNVSEFSISSGVLTSIGTMAAGSVPAAIAVTPTAGTSGPYVYVVNQTDGTISAYSAATGTLSSLGAPTSSGGSNPSAIAISPKGDFAYVVNKSSNSISTFTISSSGVLTSFGSPLATGNQPVSVSIISNSAQPDGAFAYVANLLDNSVSIFPISSSGTLGAATTQMIGNGPVSIVAATN